MTMLEDDQLRALFTRAAEVFDVPAAGAAAISAARADNATQMPAGGGDAPEGAHDPDEEGDDNGAPSRRQVGRLRRVGLAAGRHRVLSVAACVVALLVVVGLVGAVVRSTSSPTSTSSLRAVAITPAHKTTSTKTPAPALAPATTTTAPRAFAARPGTGATSKQSAAAGLPDATDKTNGSFAPQSTGAKSTKAAGSATTATTAPTLPTGAAAPSAKVEQTGTLGLTVKKGALTQSMTQLSSIATGAGGFVAGTQTQAGSGGAGPPSGSMTLQVPEAAFASVLAQAQALGKTSNLSTKATDVTGQYNDLADQISALQASQQQYLTIMTKATSIGDILSVQEQLDTIDQQIKTLQGQLQSLTAQTTYSTLTVTLSEPAATPPPAPVRRSGVAKAWHDSITGFADGVEGVIRYAGPVIFALLCLALVWLGGRALWRRYQRHNL